MAQYTVKVKGKPYRFTSDLSDEDAASRVARMVKKQIVTGPFAADLVKRYYDEGLSPGYTAYLQFMAVSKKARKEFGTEKDNQKIINETAKNLSIIFGKWEAVQAVRDVLRFAGVSKQPKWEAILSALRQVPDGDKPVRPRKRLIE